jgi:serine/threonine-protein kinase
VIGETVGNYRIIDVLSKGGMGVVYIAKHVHIGRKAAVKVLLPSVSDKPELVPRFFAEARATASIGHPGIVEIFDFGRLENGNAYLIMELLEGVPLTKRLSVPMPEDRALALMEHITSALAAAHAKGIVHRDLKPANIILVSDPGVRFGERTKLLDFGIAKLTEDNDLGKDYATRTGTIMGTPAYMSPEQCRGASDVDHRADLYALGCILFHMVCARPPFLGFGAGEIIGMQQFVPPQPPRSLNPEVSPAVESLIMRLLEKNPAARVQSAEALLMTLARLTQSDKVDTGGWSLHERHVSSYRKELSSSESAAREPAGAATKSQDDHGETETRSLSESVMSSQGGEQAARMPLPGSIESMGPTAPHLRGGSDGHLTTFTSAVRSAEATGPVTRTAPSQRWLGYAAGSVILLGMGFGAWVGMSGTKPGRQPAPATRAAASPGDATPQAPEPDTQPAPGPGKPVAPASQVPGGQAAGSERVAAAATAPAVPATGAEEILVTVRSTPSEATVYLGARKLGTTPLERHILRYEPGKDELVLTVKKSGYRDQTIELDPSSSIEHQVKLVKVDRRGPRTSAPAPHQDTKSRSQPEPPGPQQPVNRDGTANPWE